MKSSVVSGFFFLALLLPAMVYSDMFVNFLTFEDDNCTVGSSGIGYFGGGDPEESYFFAFPSNDTETFESAILTNWTGNVSAVVACQFGEECNNTNAIQISFNLSDLGACSTAGPPGTQYNKFLVSGIPAV